jgi:hypothetical protein
MIPLRLALAATLAARDAHAEWDAQEAVDAASYGHARRDLREEHSAIGRAEASRMLAEFCAMPRVTRLAAWRLACSFGHEWAGCSLAAVTAGGDALAAEWARVEAEDAATRIGGYLSPSAVHTTGTGRTSWAVNARHARIDISRPTGVVLSIEVPHDALRKVSVLALDTERVFVRHIQALAQVLTALHSAGYASAVVNALIAGGVGRQAYHEDAYNLEVKRLALAV